MRTETILVIPFADGIGDFINVQPLVRALKGRFPEASFAIAASEHGNLLNNDPGVEVLTPAGLKYEPGRMAVALRPLLPQKLLAWMAGPMFDRELGPFDLVINFFYAWERAMDFRTYWTPQVPAVPGAVHTLDCLADELERELELSIPREQREPYLVLRPSARQWASRFWSERGLERERVVGLVPSTNMVIKRWPISSWLDLDAHLRAEGYRTLLFCDRPDSSVQRAFERAGSTAIPVHTSLDNVAGLLDRCDLVASVDTGLLHMAGALGVPWVGLFGPTNPEVTGPYDPGNGISLVAPFGKTRKCGGCWKHFKYEDDTCRALHQGSCMDYLQEPDVLRACLQMLHRARRVHPLQPYTFPAQPPAGLFLPDWAGSSIGA
jgi:ADP-heptose:LPS heptosyltransferase